MKHLVYGLAFCCLLSAQSHADSMARQVDDGAFDGLYEQAAGWSSPSMAAQITATVNTFFGRQDLNTSLKEHIPSPRTECLGPGQDSSSQQSGSDWLLDAVEYYRILMLNENHYRIESRLFLWRLLPALKARGFSWLGVETLNPKGPLRDGAYGPEDGYYSGEPAFTALLRRAQELGITLFAYEAAPAPSGSTRQERLLHREMGQAQAIEAVFRDMPPREKMLIFAGWSHIAENPIIDDEGGSQTWMAAYLKQAVQSDPLTVDLATCRFPSTDPMNGMDGRVNINDDGVVLVNGQYKGVVDAQIALPADPDKQSSPEYYRQLLGVPVKSPPEFLPEATPILIQAHRADRLGLLADDRVLLYPGEALPLYLTPGFEYVLRAQDGDGRVLGKKTVSVP